MKNKDINHISGGFKRCISCRRNTYHTIVCYPSKDVKKYNFSFQKCSCCSDISIFSDFLCHICGSEINFNSDIFVIRHNEGCHNGFRLEPFPLSSLDLLDEFIPEYLDYKRTTIPFEVAEKGFLDRRSLVASVLNLEPYLSSFHCRCPITKLNQLSSLELNRSVLKENETAHVLCSFCNSFYQIH